MRGDYVSSIDSDDYVGKDYLKILMELVTEYTTPLACVAHLCVFKDEASFVSSQDTRQVIPNETILKAMAKGQLIFSAWGKLIHKDLFTTARFPVGRLFKDAAGIWHRDRFRPLTAALVNLGLNLATVQWLGMYGVLLSSVIAISVVEIPWLFHNLFREVYPQKYLGKYVRMFLGLAAVALVSCAGSFALCALLHPGRWLSLFINACISFVVPNIFFFAIYGRRPMFRESVAQIKRVLLKKGT